MIDKVDYLNNQTGMMIEKYIINEKYILFILILDDEILVFNEINIPQFKDYFSKNKDKIQLLFQNDQVKQEIEEIIDNNMPI